MKKQKETENEIVDIFNGDVINVWKDTEYTYISFPFSTISIPNEAWVDVKNDLDKLAEL